MLALKAIKHIYGILLLNITLILTSAWTSGKSIRNEEEEKAKIEWKMIYCHFGKRIVIIGKFKPISENILLMAEKM